MNQIQPSYAVFLCLSSFSYSLVELEKGQVIYVIFVPLAMSDKGKTIYLGQNTC